VFSKNGEEFFFAVDNQEKGEIYYSSLNNVIWSSPKIIIGDEKYGYNDPMLSPKENRLYFISISPLEKSENKEDIDIWYVEKRSLDGQNLSMQVKQLIHYKMNITFHLQMMVQCTLLLIKKLTQEGLMTLIYINMNNLMVYFRFSKSLGVILIQEGMRRMYTLHLMSLISFFVQL